MSEERRRTPDPIVAKLVTDVDDMKKDLAKNTVVTEQVRDILASFKVIAVVAKWVTTIVGMCAALIALFKAGGGDIRFK